MRLWHFQLLSFIPNSQLIAQKRECDLIWKDIKNSRQTNHILINYIWEYEDFEHRLSIYYYQLKEEFKKRNFYFRDNSIKSELTFEETKFNVNPFPMHHTFSYLQQNYFNLQEKYQRGQKDFTKEQYDRLTKFYLNFKNLAETLDGVIGYVPIKNEIN